MPDLISDFVLVEIRAALLGDYDAWKADYPVEPAEPTPEPVGGSEEKRE